MIRERDRLERTPAHTLALDCLEAGIAAADPGRVVRDALEVSDGTLWIGEDSYDLDAFEEVVVLGGGNAAGRVGAALEAVLGERVDRGVLVTDNPTDTRVDQVEGSHPKPDAGSVEGASHALELAEAAGEDTLVLAVITGGGSALLAAPAGELELADLRATTEALLASGADIDAINAVRKHLSRVKGGRLARAAAPATIGALVFSDVVGNDLAVIASGPLAPDDTTYADALDVLDRYDVEVPEGVRDHLQRGASGHPETPGEDDRAFERVTHHVLADNATALAAARETARERGVEGVVLSSRIEGEASQAGKFHAAVGAESLATGSPAEPPIVFLSGGETTVTVTGDGRGGPNLEFALSGALDAPEDVVVASVDTDGVDGATDAAGAIADAGTVADPQRARSALADNDVYDYLDDAGALIRTGFTGTNVNDLRVVVVGVED